MAASEENSAVIRLYLDWHYEDEPCAELFSMDVWRAVFRMRSVCHDFVHEELWAATNTRVNEAELDALLDFILHI